MKHAVCFGSPPMGWARSSQLTTSFGPSRMTCRELMEPLTDAPFLHKGIDLVKSKIHTFCETHPHVDWGQIVGIDYFTHPRPQMQSTGLSRLLKGFDPQPGPCPAIAYRNMDPTFWKCTGIERTPLWAGESQLTADDYRLRAYWNSGHGLFAHACGLAS